MKKLRIAAIIVALILTVTALASCDTLKLEDVQADPMKYVTDGADLTFGTTPFADISLDQDKVSYQLGIDGENDHLDLALYLDMATVKGAFDLAFEGTTSYTDDNGEEISEKEETKLSAYYADKQIAVKTDLLKDLLDYDSVGIDLGITKDEFKETALFDVLLSLTEMTEEDFEKELKEAEEAINIEKLKEDISKYIEDIKKLYNEQYEVTGVTEESLTIEEKEYKVIVVAAKVNEKLYDDMVGETVELITGLADTLNEKVEGYTGYTEEDIKEMLESISDTMPDISGTIKYYLSAKTGALLKITGDTKTVTKDENDEKSTTETKYDVMFGAQPEVLFLPSFVYETKTDVDSFYLDGKSSVVDGKFVLEGIGDYEDENTEEDKDETEDTYKFVIDKEGAYTLTFTDEDGDYDVTGKFECTESKIALTADVTELNNMEDDEEATEGEDDIVDLDTDVITDISLVITFGEDVPAMPEYKNILDFTEEDISPILDMLGMGAAPGASYDDMFRTELMYYLELDEAELADYLSKYAEFEFDNEQDYLYASYADCVYMDLVYYCEVDKAKVDAVVNSVTSVGGSYYDLAVTMYDSYFMLTAPSEDEVRDYLDNYDIYGYSSQQEVIDELKDFYGDYVTIPEEYLSKTEA